MPRPQLVSVGKLHSIEPDRQRSKLIGQGAVIRVFNGNVPEGLLQMTAQPP